MTSKNKTEILFIIGGEEVLVDANLHEPLHAARDLALAKSKETGRKDPNDWDVKDAEKNILDAARKVESYNFPNPVTLYLVPKVSGGGN